MLICRPKGGRKARQADNSEKFSKVDRKEDQGGEESGGGLQYLQAVSSRGHSMREPTPDSVPWKKNRQNISSEDPSLMSSALARINKFANDGSFMEKISKRDSKNTNVSNVERRDSEQKAHQESSKITSSVSTQKLNANQLVAKVLQRRMEGKHKEADQLSHESATRKIDKNVWEQIHNFKKCLLKMIAQQGKDVVLNKSPMYFKETINEAEEEWSQHDMKKLIPTSGYPQQVIPENVAYFHVEFGLDRGPYHR